DFDLRTIELPSGSESEHNLVHAENGASGDDVFPEAHICAQCHLNPPDGSERSSAYNDEWLHPRCEEAFIRARMAEEGVLWEAPHLERRRHGGRNLTAAPRRRRPRRRWRSSSLDSQRTAGRSPSKSPWLPTARW